MTAFLDSKKGQEHIRRLIEAEEFKYGYVFFYIKPIKSRINTGAIAGDFLITYGLFMIKLATPTTKHNHTSLFSSAFNWEDNKGCFRPATKEEMKRLIPHVNKKLFSKIHSLESGTFII